MLSDSSAQKVISSMQRNSVDDDMNGNASAKRLKVLLSGLLYDIFGADVYYRSF